MTPARKRFLVGSLISFEFTSAVFAWRDITRRANDQLRGKRVFWRAFIVLNPGNSLAYWVFGRRQ